MKLALVLRGKGSIASFTLSPKIPISQDLKMRDKPEAAASVLILEEARELQAQGQSLRALLLALDALVQSLNHLQGALNSLQQNAAQSRGGPRPSPAFPEQSHPNSCPLPVKKPPVLH